MARWKGSTEVVETVRVKLITPIFTLQLEHQGIPLPDVSYQITFANGDVVKGTVNKDGVAKHYNPPPGDVTIEYLDPDD